MDDSVLEDIKKLLQIQADYDVWDMDIIMHINSTLFTLKQLGVISPEGAAIEDASAIWSDFLGPSNDYRAVKSYVGMKVRLAFDPPTSGPLVEALERQISEYEWRLNVEAEKTVEEVIVS